MWRAAESLYFKFRCRTEALRNVKPFLDIMNRLQPKQEDLVLLIAKYNMEKQSPPVTICYNYMNRYLTFGFSL